jgi:CRISPR system Cascade subunit CasA
MPDQRFNLLSEPLFTVDAGGGGTPPLLTLPGVLSRLARGEPTDFHALQPHQQHAWHAFTVQVAALAIHASGNETPPDSEDTWRTMLLGLTGGDDAPWCLVVGDLSKPAFMQPPVPERTLNGWSETASPDEIDILVTARNHDVKSSRIAAPSPEHWIYALVTLQTMSGYDGRKNYGIARMNGAHGNRPCVAASPNLLPALRFQRDLEVLLAARERMIEDYGYQRNGGAALLWVIEWGGGRDEQLPLDDCDPFFIEVARRVRLAWESSSIVCYRKGSEAPRVNAEQRKGDLGDPWVPVRHDGASLTAKNLSYRTLHKILFSADYATNPARRVLPEDGETPVLVAQLFARGKGKTEGYHERYIPIPREARAFFVQPDPHSQLALLAGDFIKSVDELQNKVLKPALLTLLQGDPKKLDFKDERAKPQIDALDSAVDQIFFARLFALSGRSDALEEWKKEILGLAENVLREAFDSVPIPLARRYRAIAVAERKFNGAARKFAPQLYVREEDSDGRPGTTTD